MMPSTTIDFDSLPTALLNEAKQHSRIEHDRDDTLLKGYLAQAISMLEKYCSITIFDGSYQLLGEELLPADWSVSGWWTKVHGLPSGGDYLIALQLPINNVRGVLAHDVNGVDISSSFGIRQNYVGGAVPAYLLANSTLSIRNTEFEFDAGIDDPAMMVPALRGLILRLAAAKYENREADITLFAEPYITELMTMWSPSV